MGLQLRDLIAIEVAIRKYINNMFTSGISTSTPRFPHRRNYNRAKAKIPNDGRWHMKHHRDRN